MVIKTLVLLYFMKILKNLLGDQSKIDVDEILVRPNLLLGKSVIVETGSNSDGHYVKYGDGLQVCWGKFNHNFDETRDKFPIFSKAFKDTNYYVDISGGDSSWQAAEMSAFIGAGPHTISSPRVLGSPKTGSFYGLRTYIYYAVGRWK